jgi:hypothetical protein
VPEVSTYSSIPRAEEPHNYLECIDLLLVDVERVRSVAGEVNSVATLHTVPVSYLAKREDSSQRYSTHAPLAFGLSAELLLCFSLPELKSCPVVLRPLLAVHLALIASYGYICTLSSACIPKNCALHPP